MTCATVDCPDAAPDRPDVIVFPPVIPLATLAIAGALQWLAPLGWIADFDQGWRIGAGAFTVFVGLLTTSAGRRALLRHGTNVNPKQPTIVLVTEGVFARSRNPLYVGVSVALCGIALIHSIGNLTGFGGPYLIGWSRKQPAPPRQGCWCSRSCRWSAACWFSSAATGPRRNSQARAG